MIAYVVVGAESSGNRALHNLLVESGCLGHRGYKIPFNQPLDVEIPEPTQPISWLRSFPHAGSYPDLKDMTDVLVEKGYQPMIVVIMRSMWATAYSQLNREFEQTYAGAVKRVEDAYRQIFSQVSVLPCPFIVVQYSELSNLKSRRHIGELLGLKLDESFDFRNEDNKYDTR